MKPISTKISFRLIYIIIWIIILIFPLMMSFSTNGWALDHRTLTTWYRLCPIIILFIINTVILLPRFLFRKKAGLYLISIIGLSLLFTIISTSCFPLVRDKLNTVGIQLEPQGNEFAQKAGKERHEMPPRRNGPPGSLLPGNMPHGKRMPHENLSPPPFKWFFVLNQFGLILLIIGLNTAVEVTHKWIKDQQKQKEQEKEHLKSELTFLQHQVSPHFLMNTLNNIHALVDIDSEKAKQSIVTLSHLMRYLLYESGNTSIKLKKEIEFIRSYLNLTRLRLPDDVDISFRVPDNIFEVELPPLLFIVFIENAFKYGISYQQKSFIHIKFEQSNNYIIFTCINSYSGPREPVKHSGIGLDNIRKRLMLLYGNQYSLEIRNKDDQYLIILNIPIKHAT